MQSVEKKIIPLIKKTVEDYYGSDVSRSPDYCRIVTDRHFARLKALLDQTRGTVVLGGQHHADSRFLAPTVVTDVTLNDSLMKVGNRV